MLKLRPTFEQIEREARTHRLKILPEKQKRTQQGILLDDVDFDDFDLGKYDKKTVLFNDNPDKGTQTDNFDVTPSITESESMKALEEEVKQTQTDESEASVEKEHEREREPQRERERGKSIMRRMYDAMFGEDEFKEEREEMRSRRQQIEEEEEDLHEAYVEKKRSEESDDSLPMNVKKSYEPSSSSSSSSRRSSNRSVLLPVDEVSSRASENSLPVEEEALSEYVHSSPQQSSEGGRSSPLPVSVPSSVPSNRTIEYVEESPPQSVISSRRSQETIEYIRSRSSSRRSSVQSVSS